MEKWNTGILKDRNSFSAFVLFFTIPSFQDDYMLFADYQAYVDCQQKVSEAYRDQKNWTRMSILNSARVGRFSSDRSIREYCRDIWNVSPITTDEGTG